MPWHTQILADQLTLFQPGGTNYAHLISNYYWHTRIFRPSDGPAEYRKSSAMNIFQKGFYPLLCLMRFMVKKAQLVQNLLGIKSLLKYNFMICFFDNHQTQILLQNKRLYRKRKIQFQNDFGFILQTLEVLTFDTFYRQHFEIRTNASCNKKCNLR